MTSLFRRAFVVLATAAALFGVATTAHAVTIHVSPSSTTLRVGAPQTFTASVWGTQNKSVYWSVNGILGGNAMVGTITAAGVYTAPLVVPVAPVTIVAKSIADPTVTFVVSATVLQPLPVVTSVAPRVIAPGPFTLTISGSGFVAGTQVFYGTTALTTTVVSATRVTASGQASLVPGGLAAVKVSNPNPGASSSSITTVQVRPSAPMVSAAAATRFLQQTSWGPDPASVARVQQIGFEQYLQEQFAAPASTYPNYSDNDPSLIPVQNRFFTNAMNGQDQLRQRVAFALSQIFVISGFKNFKPVQYVPHLRMLSDHAFGNYGTLLREITRSPAMGRFLDLALNEKANAFTQTAPNENYARELMQLFTVGTERLNLDGTPVLVNGRPVPNYDQDVVREMARALTGWTYPTKPGATPQQRNPAYFVGQLEPVDKLHDTDPKTLLGGVVVPGGLTPEQDLNAVLAAVWSHPNVAPFVSRRLIQHLVTSNPSPAYVARVATAFNNGAAGRGDLKTVVRAIVLDPEARLGDSQTAPSTSGHLREPIVAYLSMMRAMGARLDDPSRLPGLMASAGQSLFYAPSVFNYFSATYNVPSAGIRGPEFEIFTPSAAVYRANLAMLLSFAPQSVGISIDLSAFEQFSEDPAALVEAVNQALLAGKLGSAERRSIEEAVASIPASVNRMRSQTALYLMSASNQYQVQR